MIFNRYPEVGTEFFLMNLDGSQPIQGLRRRGKGCQVAVVPGPTTCPTGTAIDNIDDFTDADGLDPDINSGSDWAEN